MVECDGGAKQPRKVAMNPDRLRKLIDSPTPANASREVHAALVKDQTLVKSWNGERCDVRPFEKLSEPANVLLAKDLRAVNLKDAAVFPSGLQVTDVKVRYVLI